MGPCGWEGLYFFRSLIRSVGIVILITAFVEHHTEDTEAHSPEDVMSLSDSCTLVVHAVKRTQITRATVHSSVYKC